MNLPRLLIFARCPTPGTVKTRLIPTLGAEGATALYLALLRQTLATAHHWARNGVELWCDGPPTDPASRDLLAGCALPVRIQEGPELGARMYHALASALLHADAALLIGTDCPELSAAVLSRAAKALRTHDAVLGPTLDGGYVLIGLRRPERSLFEAMPWGSGVVLEHTRQRLRTLGWRWHELEPLRDIDRPEDLRYLTGLTDRVTDTEPFRPENSTDALA